MKGIIFDIKEMAIHDGPGLRTTVFFKGCPLRCQWCHNPEGLSSSVQLLFKQAKCKHCGACLKNCSHEQCQPFGRCLFACPENCLELAGSFVEEKTLANELKKNAQVLGDMFGGFTFSGGEPLAQAEFLLLLCKELKEYHLCIETSGYADEQVFQKVVEAVDFVIMDVKLADCKEHLKYTGVGNEMILKNLEFLKTCGKPYLIRTPLIPQITDTKENLTKIEQLIGDGKWEKLPYNEMAGAKYNMLGMEYPLSKSKING